MRKRLRTTETRVGRLHWPYRQQDSALSIQHRKGRALVGQPPKSCQRNHSIVTYNDESSETMPNTWKPSLSTIGGNSVFDYEVATINANDHTVAIEGDDAVRRSDQIEIAVLKMLRYVLRSCHWSTFSFGG
jgi:hypothetical protein